MNADEMREIAGTLNRMLRNADTFIELRNLVRSMADGLKYEASDIELMENEDD